MQIAVLSKFDADGEQAFADPLKVWSSAASAEKSFDPQGLAFLRKVADFTIPYLHVRGTFEAGAITSATPHEMAMEVPGSHPALTATLSLLRAAKLFPISYQYENGGQLAVHISPRRPDSIDRRSFLKSTSALRGHTDASFNPTPEEFRAGDQEFAPSPDFLALACIRNPDEVPTNVTSLSEVLAKLTDEEISYLTAPIFILKPQPSFEIAEDAVRVGAVLWRDASGVYCCRFSHKYISVSSEMYPEAANALEKFQRVVAECAHPIVLGPGDILILNNRTLVHGRGEIGGEWDPEARWLMRMYASREQSSVICQDPARPWVLK
jgi:L-asparagine oxygenase